MKSTATGGVTRLRMLQMAGALGIGALGTGAMLAGCSSDPAKESASDDEAAAGAANAGPVEISVYDPTGSIEITQTFAPRLDALEGKTIAFVSDDAWEDDRTFALIGELFAEKYPSVTVLTQDNFIHGIEAITKANNGLPEAMQEKGVDAVIVGNAG